MGLASSEMGPNLAQSNDSVVGAYDAQVHDIRTADPENQKYKDAIKAKFGEEIPSYEGGCAYDGMRIMYRLIQSQQGKLFDGPAAMKSVIDWKFDGARGPQLIEASRGTTMNVYIRRVVKDNGQLRLDVAYTAEAVPSIPRPAVGTVRRFVVV
jgi:Periplasmic binding protein